MHVLAYCYHWDRDTLWNMGKSERNMWYKMVLAQKKAEQESLNIEDNSVSAYREF
jgi:hypothetical protein